ncbi:Uncharacterized conserved protein [Rhizobium sp. NFR07]|uniref:mitofilin family membrane protein n=1 Tax=Rhizobium sp. NFR07 TaxID=1566262 RepID=UPI0008E32676|nr:mitofilin family membrane protein [Rhizobium sp. NFR07]SFB25240.1 Uncharacterized conserved protein [Rhizobium sp. NFR07]
MVPEKPPRRSKANKEPVTIDLTAEETPAVAEPVRANDTDDLIPASEKDAAGTTAASPSPGPVKEKSAGAEMPKAETPRFDEPEPAAAPPSETPPGTTTTGTTGTAGTVPEAEAKPATEEKAAAETASDLPPKSQPKEPSREYSARQSQSEPKQPRPEPKQPQRSAPATSTLVAAGIFGGIVALLLAGSMQYAGFIPGSSSSPSQSADADVSAELAALRQEVSALSSRPTGSSDDLTARVAALESSASTGAPDEALTQRLAALESELSGIKSTTEANAGRLQQAEAQINDRGPEQQAARAVAAAALKGAIDRGGSFEAELRTYETVAGGDQAIAELQPFATKGVLSRTELQRQASTVANSMIDAVSQPDPNEGIASRLLSSAMSVVKVRRVGDVEGDTPDAIVARFEDRLRSGNLPAAAREWDALPDPAKAASQEFKQELDARIQVENLVGGALTRAIAGTQG